MTARDRRALVLGGTIALTAIVVRLGYAGVCLGASRLDEARQATALAARARVLVAEGPVRQAALKERAQALVDLAPALLAGSSGAEAAAGLAGELNALAARHRLVIARLDPGPDSLVGSLTRIELRVQAEGDLAGVYGFIHELETGALLLSLAEVAVTAEQGDAPMERLRCNGTVQGWMVTKQAAGGAGAAPPGEGAGR